MEKLEFKKLDGNVEIIKDYVAKTPIGFCDITIGTIYMWREEFVFDYAVVCDTLILKQSSKDYENAFFFPIGENVDYALSLIQDYCAQNALPLLFCCIDNKYAVELAKRYSRLKVYNDRDWSDYIYTLDQFKTYSGKKLSGQRNHVNKFKRFYPNFTFKEAQESDLPLIKDFLSEYESGEDFSMWSAKVEQQKVWDYVQNFSALNQCGGLIFVDGKLVALSFGEIVGDTLYVHIEKGLKTYDGVYPTLASEFAKRFGTNGVKYINREEDCGDMGLRVSKLQYHPIEIKEKNFVIVKTLFDSVVPPIIIRTERLTVTDIFETDKPTYFSLYTDTQVNEFYGYDYREDFKGESVTPEYFYGFMQELKAKKEEYSLAVRLNGQMIGEIVIYNFDYFGGVEIGFRFFKSFWGYGYAYESVLAVLEYLKQLKCVKIKSRAYKQNLPSVKLIEKLGFTKTEESAEQYFFELEL